MPPITRPTIACTECGAETEAACDCCAPYVSKSVRAAAAIEAAPEKSDRAIAADLGISKDTVRRARPTGANAPVARTGIDGRVRKVHWQRRVNPSAHYNGGYLNQTDPELVAMHAEQEALWKARLIKHADAAVKGTENAYRAAADAESIAAAKAVVDAWTKVHESLKARAIPDFSEPDVLAEENREPRRYDLPDQP
jgi:hypothetical protein